VPLCVKADSLLISVANQHIIFSAMIEVHFQQRSETGMMIARKRIQYSVLV